MSMHEMKWTSNEKKVARVAFDLAYKRGMEEIKILTRESSEYGI